ncbi:DUF397 domain-containing protein [Endozoicomonas elysicola]|uniref:DUF397 domain-containing protein n=1 Tax=Endozoicomonas elysicola TaxID=305900 RepID=UPI0006885E19|nr:DUF397 domain-containing protein [Endozoicomonas elysicola]
MNKFFTNDSNFVRACGGGTVGYCVAVAINKEAGLVGIRDTKDADKSTLVFDREEWKHFITAVKAGEFDA